MQSHSSYLSKRKMHMILGLPPFLFSDGQTADIVSRSRHPIMHRVCYALYLICLYIHSLSYIQADQAAQLLQICSSAL